MKNIYLVEEFIRFGYPDSVVVKAFSLKKKAKEFINSFPSRAPRRISERYSTKWRRLFSIRTMKLE